MANLQSVTINDPSGAGDRTISAEATYIDNNDATVVISLGQIQIGAGDDATAIVNARANNRLFSLRDDEENQLVDEQINTDVDPLVITLNPQWSTDRRIAKKLLKWMIRERDPRIVIWLEPLITYLQSNYNATQMANFLNLTVPQIIKINNRVNAILNDTGNCKSLLLSFDSYQDDFGDDD